MSEQVLMVFTGAGMFQAFLLAALMYFNPKRDKTVTTYLALYLVIMYIPTMTPAVQHYASWQYGIFFRSLMLVSGPLLYLYVCSYREVITFRRIWPHFILVVIQLGFDTALYIETIEAFPLAHATPAEILRRPVNQVLVGIRFTQMILYTVLASRSLTLYQQSLKYSFSETSRISLSWIRWLIRSYLILLFFVMANYFLSLRYPEKFSLWLLLNTSIMTVYAYLVTFWGISQPTFWQVSGQSKEVATAALHDAEVMGSNNPDEEPERASKSVISKEKADDLVARTITLMEEEKLFCEAELTLQQLADKLQSPAYQVSQAINEGMKKNFYDLVNGYRVEEAKRLLVDPRHRNHKVLSLGFDAGFNSKTTFNTVFKKFTGLSPSDFRSRQGVIA